MPEPWSDWSPGVLSGRQIEQLIEEKYIHVRGDAGTISKASSIDLTLSEQAYRMKQGSVKPFGDRYEGRVLNGTALAEPITPGEGGIFSLEATKTYVFMVREKLNLQEAPHIFGEATAKSSVGRVDVLARLIVDGMDRYEGFTPGKVSGEMFVEVTPITFPVRVKVGTSLSQLRLFYGSPDISLIPKDKLALYPQLLFPSEVEWPPDEPMLSVDLSPTRVNRYEDASAFVASGGSDVDPIDLWKNCANRPSPTEYWDIQRSDEKRRLTLEPSSFYLLRSKERVCLTKQVAAYCRATDETIGEMRIHYAGFVHPGFGTERDDNQEGTPLIFEVRGHDVKVSLNDTEKMAKLMFYSMSEPCDAVEQSYNEQILTLSKFFADWPDTTAAGENGGPSEQPGEEE